LSKRKKKKRKTKKKKKKKKRKKSTRMIQIREQLPVKEMEGSLFTQIKKAACSKDDYAEVRWRRVKAFQPCK